MKKFLDWFTGGYDKEFYKKHQADIQKSNAKIISIGLTAVALFLAAFIIAEMIKHNLGIDILSFTVMLCIDLILLGIQILLVKSYRSTLVISSIFIMVFYAFLIMEETYFYPWRCATIYFVFMVALPISIISPVYAIANINFMSYVAFVIFSYITKERSIFYLDVMFGMCCLITSVLLGRRVLLNRFEAFALSDTLRYQSRYDPLTNIYNRRAGHVKLEEVMKVEDNIAFAIVDIDDFKLYNDTHGHLKGDEALKTIATIFLKHVKEYGFFVSRFGGEEFVFAAWGKNYDKMEEILQKSSEDIKKANLVDENSKYGYLTFSAGYTMTTKCKEIDKLLVAADQALYEAKNDGKNKIKFVPVDEE